jgi:hypothetical protein
MTMPGKPMSRAQNEELHELARAVLDAEKASDAAIVRAAAIETKALDRTKDARTALVAKAAEYGIVGMYSMEARRGRFVTVEVPAGEAEAEEAAASPDER